MASDFAAYVAKNHDAYDNEYLTPDATNGAAIITGSLVATAAADGDAVVHTAGTEKIFGIACVPYAARTLYADGKGAAGNVIPVSRLSGTEIVGMCSDTTPAASHIGDTYEVVKLASNNWAVNTGATTNAKVKVVAIDIASGTFFVQFLRAGLE